MARHRLTLHANETVLVCRSCPDAVVWPPNRLTLAAKRQRAIRAVCSSAFSVAAIVPLVFAGAVGAAAPRSLMPAAVLRGSASAPVASIRPSDGDHPGPNVVASTHSPAGLHIAVPPASGPPTPLMAVKPSDVLGIPSMALAAYRNAEQMMATSNPGCGISWNLLAGVGRIESGHANGGATDARGTAVQPIYGPALDGTLPGNEVIAQSSVAGSVTYARAIGPMQFLPGTWARYASDGDGDGVADPQNLYDSTLAAARYLCSGGLNLRDQSQVMAAILRYNNSIPYARNVLGWAAAYATGVVPVDLPPVAGQAPPLGDRHLENQEGLGPGLPLNIHGLPPTDSLAQTPLVDFGPSEMAPQQGIWPSQSFAPPAPGCTVICINPQGPPPNTDPPGPPPPG